MFTIHPAAESFFEKIARGDKVVWHSELRFLYCFGQAFNGDWGTVMGSRYFGMYEAMRLMHDPEKNLVGIKFYCADRQILERPALSSIDFSIVTLTASMLLDDAINSLREDNYEKEDWEKYAEELQLFLEAERITIPPSVIMEMVGDCKQTH